MLAGLGVGKGDRVIVYMPMVPEALVAMLACARLGAVHSVVFGGFAANELATRINDAQPKVIVSASCGIESQKIIPYKPLLDHAIELASSSRPTADDPGPTTGDGRHGRRARRRLADGHGDGGPA